MKRVITEIKDSREVTEAARTFLKQCLEYKTQHIGMTIQVDDIFLDVSFEFKISDFNESKTITS